MNLKIGIVGLPNVGKSTLFNALTNAGALAANYPFATIEPNVGIVPVPDERLDVLAKMTKLFPQQSNLSISPDSSQEHLKAKVSATNFSPISANARLFATSSAPSKTTIS